jgi:hypothetical protein
MCCHNFKHDMSKCYHSDTIIYPSHAISEHADSIFATRMRHHDGMSRTPELVAFGERAR